MATSPILQSFGDIIPDILSACQSWGIDARHTIALHGSRVEGFSNQDSDVDFWIISPEKAVPPLVPVFSWVSNRRLQPESISCDTFLLIANRINSVDLESTEALMALLPGDINMYYRFATCVPITNHRHCELLKKEFRKQHISAIIARRNGIAAATELEKATVFARTNDELEEFSCLRRAVEFAVDSFLALQGEAYPNRKWRFEQLSRACGENSSRYQQAWRLKAPGWESLSFYRSACKDCVKSIIGDCQPVRVFLKRLRGTCFQLGRKNFLLVPSTAVYEIGPGGALIWRLIESNATFEALADALMSANNLDATNAVGLLSTHFNDFRSYGLIELMPTFE